MSIFEYDEEKHLKNEREFGYRKGHEAGLQEGMQEGETRLVKLMQILIDEKRSEEVSQVLADVEYRKQLYKEYQL